MQNTAAASPSSSSSWCPMIRTTRSRAASLSDAARSGDVSTIEIVVEAAGVEPASENASERTSTRVGTLFRVSRLPAAAGLQAQQAD